MPPFNPKIEDCRLSHVNHIEPKPVRKLIKRYKASHLLPESIFGYTEQYFCEKRGSKEHQVTISTIKIQSF